MPAPDRVNPIRRGTWWLAAHGLSRAFLKRAARSGDADFPLSYIASDNILGGRMAARALVKIIGDKGKVYVSNVKPGVSTIDQREEGFKLEMKENFPKIEVLETQFNENDANKAASLLQAVFARNSDLKGVFGANLFSAIGSANGVQQAGQTGTIKVVAFDAPTSIVDNINSGLVDVAIAQHPAEIGYFGVVSAYAHLTGQSIPTMIGTGFTVMTKPVRRFTDAQGHTRTKGNMDVEIAVDMLELAPHLDEVVLFSGDGDFKRLVQAVQAKGVRVTVVSTTKSQPPQISDDLRRQADEFLDLADIMNEFSKPKPAFNRER